MIGKFDDSSVVMACLPACLANGGASSLSGNLQSFPIFNGPQAGSRVLGHFHGNAVYSGGAVDVSQDNASIVTNLLQNFSNSSKFTCHTIINLPLNDPHAGDAIIGGYNSTSASSSMLLEYNTDIRFFFDNPHGNVGCFLTIFDSVGFASNIFMILSDDFPTTGTHALTVVKDGTSARLLIDGVSYPLVTDLGFTNDTYNLGDVAVPNPLTIGSNCQDSDTTGLGFRNKVRQFILYNDALTNDQVSTLVNLGPDLGGLYGYDNGDGTMRLDDGSGTAPVSQVGTKTFVPGVGDLNVSYSWRINPATNLPVGVTQDVFL